MECVGPTDDSSRAHLSLLQVGTSRANRERFIDQYVLASDVPARVLAGGTNVRARNVFPEVAPLNAARTASQNKLFSAPLIADARALSLPHRLQ